MTDESSPETPDVSLYLHIPYCLAKCPYCDFNTYAADTWPEVEYADALLDELALHARGTPWAHGRRIGSIFFGGGTPSLFRASTIERILTRIAATHTIADAAEITIEANPGSVSREHLAALRAAGVNRLSLGIQSFQPSVLTTLGREHSAEDGRTAITTARAAGFDNLNLDLIFAVPGQTRGAWETDVAELLTYAPEHVSAYNLTFEPGTPFHTWRRRGELTPLDEDEEFWMYGHVRAACQDAGLPQYEISSFARPHQAARHNSGYWRGRDYLGLGAGAHSYARLPGWGRRWSNERLPERYMAAVTRGGPSVWQENLSFEMATAEFMFLGLRELAGVSYAAFATRFGAPLEAVHPETRTLCDDGLLVTEGDRLALTERGLLVADSVFAAFC